MSILTDLSRVAPVRFGSARLRLVHGTVRAVPFFGSDRSSLERAVFLSQYRFLTERDGSGSGLGS